MTLTRPRSTSSFTPISPVVKRPRPTDCSTDLQCLNPSSPQPSPSLPPPALTWDTLPIDALDPILDHLCLSSIHDLRLAGVGATSIPTHIHLHRVTRARIRELHLIWRSMSLDDLNPVFEHFFPSDLHSPSGHAIVRPLLRTVVRGETHARLDTTAHSPYPWPPPPTFMSQLPLLALSTIDRPVARAISRNMPELRALFLRYPQRPQSSFPWPRLSLLPIHLVSCRELCLLDISGHAFHLFPPVILQMSKLEVLILSRNSFLKHLPDDIGLRLPMLKILMAKQCALSTLPRSLLIRLEKSCHVYKDTAGLNVADCNFPNGYINNVVSQAEFPELRSQIQPQP